MEFPSRAIENAVNELASLPGIGRKTALRLALHLLKQSEADTERLGTSLIELRKNIRYCRHCGNISDEEVCKICSNPRRDASLVCVVEDTKDVIALESTHQFQGRYHVLGGLINPLQGIGPSMLNIAPLVERVRVDEVKEVIFAFSANIEGDTTAFYLSKQLAPTGVHISSIARGIPVGTDLEFTDEITLARSLINRTRLATPDAD
ncbi:MAG: recombination protein RecR [Bacteroidetes bacterium]|nr:MAG: recombination protein RecR [Bacteroidota bacterium]